MKANGKYALRSSCGWSNFGDGGNENAAMLTREHLLALSVAYNRSFLQNKADLAEYEEALDNYRQIKDFVKGSIAEKAPIIPVSAQHKLNIDVLIEAIEKTIKTRHE